MRVTRRRRRLRDHRARNRVEKDARAAPDAATSAYEFRELRLRPLIPHQRSPSGRRPTLSSGREAQRLRNAADAVRLRDRCLCRRSSPCSARNTRADDRAEPESPYRRAPPVRFLVHPDRDRRYRPSCERSGEAQSQHRVARLVIRGHPQPVFGLPSIAAIARSSPRSSSRSQSSQATNGNRVPLYSASTSRNDEPVRPARHSCAREAVVLLHLDPERGPCSRSRPERHRVSLVIRIRPRRNHQPLPRLFLVTSEPFRSYVLSTGSSL